MAKPSKTGKPESPGKSASAPGQMKKAAGMQSAKTFTKGYAKKKPKPTRDGVKS